jgi:hypothetical protein
LVQKFKITQLLFLKPLKAYEIATTADKNVYLGIQL